MKTLLHEKQHASKDIQDGILAISRLRCVSQEVVLDTRPHKVDAVLKKTEPELLSFPGATLPRAHRSGFPLWATDQHLCKQNLPPYGSLSATCRSSLVSLAR